LKKYDLEDRLVMFAADNARFAEGIFGPAIGNYYGNQLLRSAGSAALNFGETQGTRTKKDFVNKASISLKELKESRVSLKILRELAIGDRQQLEGLISECEELIAILATIIRNKTEAH